MFRGKNTQPSREQKLAEVDRKIAEEKQRAENLNAWNSVDAHYADANAQRESANRMAELSRVRQELTQEGLNPRIQIPQEQPKPVATPAPSQNETPSPATQPQPQTT